MIPPAKPGDNKRTIDLREVVNGLARIHHTLYVKCREQIAREASPTAAIIDAQSVKSAEKGGAYIDPHGYDTGKKVKGKKRHVLVDTQGLVPHAIVTSADIQDRDGGVWQLATLFGLYPFLLKLYADSGYQGPRFRAAVRTIPKPVEQLASPWALSSLAGPAGSRQPQPAKSTAALDSPQ